ncbi:hypothetical protein [Jannaschia sp. R86511]|uniref:hypothetical protein n=1 Tax=Jannaschia sp. R86511 TaxID=3093853 RepID=UPI0036D3DFD5
MLAWIGHGALTLGLGLLLVTLLRRPAEASQYRRPLQAWAAGGALLGLVVLLAAAVAAQDLVSALRVAVPVLLLVALVFVVRRAPGTDSEGPSA